MNQIKSNQNARQNLVFHPNWTGSLVAVYLGTDKHDETNTFFSEAQMELRHHNVNRQKGLFITNSRTPNIKKRNLY